MKNLTLRQRILASFLVILAIMTLMVVVDYRRLLHIEAEAMTIRDDAVPGLYYSTEIRSAWFGGFVALQDAFRADTEQERRTLLDTLPKSDQALDANVEHYRRTMSRADDIKMFESFEKALQEYKRIRGDILGASGQVDQARIEARIKTELRPAFYSGRELIAQIVAANKAQADLSSTSIGKAVDTAEYGMLISLAMAIVAAIICGYLLLRAIVDPMRDIVRTLELTGSGDLSRRLRLARKDEFNAIETGFNGMVDELTGLVGKTQRSAVQVATSVTEIAATSKQQQATASEVAATTTEIGATSREISATSRELVRTMAEVSGAAEQTASLAGSGQVGLARMEDTMRNVVDAAGSVNAKLAILNEKAGNITQVVTTITKVADQTNLLSLNAAIEAEKAGEYGRGFVVVATEIRRLADQTAVATYDIEQMVREIQSSVSAGVMGMDKFSEEVRRGMADMQQVGDQLSQIIQQVQTLAPRVQMVNEGMQAQATGAEQINQALQQLSDAAQQTVESLRQSSLAIEELTLVANDLRSGVSRFRCDRHHDRIPVRAAGRRVHGTTALPAVSHRPGPLCAGRGRHHRGAGLASAQTRAGHAGVGAGPVVQARRGRAGHRHERAGRLRPGRHRHQHAAGAAALSRAGPGRRAGAGADPGAGDRNRALRPGRFPAAGAGQPAGALSRSGPVRRRRHGAGRDRR